jgi:hypothetical protein
MVSMVNPATKLIHLLYFVSHPMTFPLQDPERIANIRRGRPIPIPNRTKFIRLVRKLVTEVLIANKIVKDAGLQGKTTAPKKNPKTNEDLIGFLVKGACILGKNLPIS